MSQSKGEVTKIDLEDTFKVCPKCGYEDGFHSMFEKIEGTESYSWKFICPSCSAIFDIGLKVER